jgi:polyferredoxin
MKTVRTIYQLFFLGLFFFLLYVATYDRLAGYPFRLFLDTDPLVAVSTVLSTGTLYRALWYAMPLLVLTIFLGRFYCGWICPLGTLQDLTAMLRGMKLKDKMRVNTYRPFQKLKYLLLLAFLVMALLGVLQIGLLDPIVLLTRALTTSIYPAIDRGDSLLYLTGRDFPLGWIAGLLLLAVLVAAYLHPRLWCKMLCPLGALLGLFSRWSIFHIRRSADGCDDCRICVGHCAAGAAPDQQLRKSECMLLLGCLEECPSKAITYGPTNVASIPPVVGPDLTRRRLAGAVLAGIAAPMIFRAQPAGVATPRPQLIRPPGSLPEPEFLARCIKCDECMHICPTNVLQPSMTEAGIEGFWTPVLNNTIGFCEVNCVLCGEACPTGAIGRITLDQKHGRGEFAGHPIVLGTAFFDQGRCLPWAMNRPCVVCQEVCPTSPKAIKTNEVTVVEEGREIHLKRPRIDPDLCIGCGICEHECPVVDRRAVYVTSVGESRSKRNVMVLKKN